MKREVLENGCLRTVRILSKTNSIPSWGVMMWRHQKKLVHIVEESIINPRDQKMVVYSYNISYKTIMDCQEKLTITSQNSDTEIVREGWINSSVKGLRRVIRNFGLQRWKSNSKKAAIGFLGTLDGKFNVGKRPDTNYQQVEKLLKATPMLSKQQV